MRNIEPYVGPVDLVSTLFLPVLPGRVQPSAPLAELTFNNGNYSSIIQTTCLLWVFLCICV